MEADSTAHLHGAGAAEVRVELVARRSLFCLRPHAPFADSDAVLPAFCYLNGA